MYFLKRLFFAIPLLLVIIALAFTLVHLTPGGPFDRERAPASPEIERNIREREQAQAALRQSQEALAKQNEQLASAYQRESQFGENKTSASV